jgi:hypothetical protein
MYLDNHPRVHIWAHMFASSSTRVKFSLSSFQWRALSTLIFTLLSLSLLDNVMVSNKFGCHFHIFAAVTQAPIRL